MQNLSDASPLSGITITNAGFIAGTLPLN